jgi:hypothetical protein
MPELVFRTRGCAQHGHPEFTLRFREPSLVPDLEQGLIRVLEESVARGTRFAAGETLRYGWATLRLKERGDDTLGIEEQSSKGGNDSWDEFVDTTLMQVWYQREVGRSLAVEDRLAFTTQGQAAVFCTRVEEVQRWFLARHEMPDPFSGWHLFCADKQHDHDSDGNVLAAELLHLTARFPFMTQFLALPVETVVGIEGPGRIRARVMIDGELVPPLDGSYLAALNDPKTLPP